MQQRLSETKPEWRCERSIHLQNDWSLRCQFSKKYSDENHSLIYRFDNFEHSDATNANDLETSLKILQKNLIFINVTTCAHFMMTVCATIEQRLTFRMVWK